MSDLRPFSLVRTGDQWIRCAFDRTFLDVDAGVVELARTTATIESRDDAPPVAAGLAFDRECRLYHSVPPGNRVDRILWRATDPLGPAGDQPAPLDLFAAGDAMPRRPASSRQRARPPGSSNRADSPSTSTIGCSSPKPGTTGSSSTTSGATA